VRSLNPVVGETNDGRLNDIRSRPITAAHVRQALDTASTGPVAEGSVGAGTGTIAFGWKGGIGTASRVLPASLGGHTLGVLVQSNFGGVLQVLGVPMGRELGRYAFQKDVADEKGDGSIVIIVATDAPVLHRNLQRLASRALMGLGRTGSSMSNGSGDYVIAFSTRRGGEGELSNDELSPLFQAVIEATEEAIYNSLFTATAVTGQGLTVEPLPLERVRELLARFQGMK
jgi:D-aminopeptidase